MSSFFFTSVLYFLLIYPSLAISSSTYLINYPFFGALYFLSFSIQWSDIRRVSSMGVSNSRLPLPHLFPLFPPLHPSFRSLWVISWYLPHLLLPHLQLSWLIIIFLRSSTTIILQRRKSSKLKRLARQSLLPKRRDSEPVKFLIEGSKIPLSTLLSVTILFL